MSKGGPSVVHQPLGSLGDFPVGPQRLNPGEADREALTFSPHLGSWLLSANVLFFFQSQASRWWRWKLNGREIVLSFLWTEQQACLFLFALPFWATDFFAFRDVLQRPLGNQLSESVSGWCPSLIILGPLPAFIFSLGPLKTWAHQKALHAAGLQLSSPFLPHANSNTITNDRSCCFP